MESKASNLSKSQDQPKPSIKILSTEAEITKTSLETEKQGKKAGIKPSNFECRIVTSELQSQIERQRSLKEELKEAEILVTRFPRLDGVSQIFKIQRLNKSLKSIRVKKKRTYYWKIFELASLYLVRLLDILAWIRSANPHYLRKRKTILFFVIILDLL